MREIKFRAWDKENKKWIYNFWLDSEDGCVYTPTDNGKNQYPDCELVEYTGLKDKNGKEIYEGDIIRDGEYGNKFDGGLGVVEFVIKNSCGYPIAGYFYRVSCDEAGVIFQDQVEVIGNIYENPDLLA